VGGFSVVSTLREKVKRMLPQRWRDRVRYVTDVRYRKSMRTFRARRLHRTQLEEVVKQSGETLWSGTAGKVASGPFQGRASIRESVGSQWTPKLLGTYEIELATVIEDIVLRGPARIVDIGAAEGYYAVGLAVRLPATTVVAFEAEDASHPLLEHLAKLNGARDRIELRGLCTSETLNEALAGSGHTLVVCDVEGAEMTLLDPATSPELRRSNILVEVHPWGHQQASEVLRGRFEDTHTIREIKARPRTIADWPAAAGSLSAAATLACMDEVRPCAMSWLWMTAR
jgi:hypothetical protein